VALSTVVSLSLAIAIFIKKYAILEKLLVTCILCSSCARYSIVSYGFQCPRLLVNFGNKIIFYGEELLAPRPTPKLKDHPLSAVRDCLFNIFTPTIHIWRSFPPNSLDNGPHQAVGGWTILK
jgi:hypothetical protein